MNAEALSRRWFLCAITYLVIGIALGVYMGASSDHSQFRAHAHINLVGWVSMALIGMIYRAFPAAAQSALAKWHFWLYQLAAPVMLASVVAIYAGVEKAEPLAGISSIVILVSLVLFWWAIFSARNTAAA